MIPAIGIAVADPNNISNVNTFDIVHISFADIYLFYFQWLNLMKPNYYIYKIITLNAEQVKQDQQL